MTQQDIVCTSVSDRLTHLQRLEAESIQIMREVVAECEKPVMLYSIGKDSAAMLHVARKALFPSLPPSPLLHVDTPLAVAEGRDVKGLYKKARRGELKNFTGIDSPYEAPEHPEIYLDTTRATSEQAAEAIVERLRLAGRLEAAG